MSATDLDAIDPPKHASVTFGGESDRKTYEVRPLKVGQLPAFARALRPISDQIEKMLRGDGLTARGIIGLVETELEHVVEAVSVATGAPRESIEDSQIDDLLEAALAVLQANRNFLKGRAAAALRLAAAMTGAGPTPAKASSEPAGASAK